MKRKVPLKALDIVVILLAVGLTGFSAFAAYGKPRNTPRVAISGSGREWVFPLDADETVAVSGPLGTTVVRIRDNRAWVESSPCANQVCVAAGRVHRQGEWVACLPNTVFLAIEGQEARRNVPDSTTW
ncbi:MAG: NusG domain II-containing protein [Treponema sp.]|nr:NusG domain II-containing protein [Treponema sp.]